MARLLPIALAAVVAAVAASSAAAAGGPQLPAAALAQYVESIPTSSGPVVTAAAAPKVTKLPPAVQEKVQSEGGADAAVIEQIATSSAYGAPQTTLDPTPEQPATALPGGAPTATATGPQTTSPTPPSAASLRSPRAYWTDGSGEDRLPILAALMLVATAGLVFAGRRASV